MNGTPPWFDRLAHDLRGPLMPLQTAAYLLRGGQVDAQRQQELLVLIDRQTRRLAGMIDELDDWSHASRGTLLATREACVPALLLDDAIGTLDPQPLIDDQTGDAVVPGDPVRLAQLLRALLEFANQRPPARIRMRVDGDKLHIDVFATGASPDAEPPEAWLRQPMPEPHDGGLGLRLLIARAIAEAHAGSLEADATADGGLHLRCRLPLA